MYPIFEVEVGGGRSINDANKAEHTHTGRLKLANAVEVLSWMSTEGQIEWDREKGTTTTTTADKSAFYIYWRRADEWADIIYDWVSNFLLPSLPPPPLFIYRGAEGNKAET